MELVVRDGRFFTIGDEGAEFFHYKKNDIIFNAAQTESLFKYGGIKGANPRGKMLATGTAFAKGNAFPGGSSGTGGGFWTNAVTGKTYGSSGDSKDEKDKSEEVIDWIEIAIDRVERAINNLATKADSIYRSWSERNKSLTDEISKVGEEISLQQKAYSKYMQAASAVGLSEEYARKVRDGSIDIDTITDETLKEKIADYQEYYEKALDCQDAILELKETESELYAQRVEHAALQYEGILGVIEHEKNMLDEYINQSEAQGWLVSSKYYDALAKNERENITELKNQRAEMISAFNEAMNSGTIAEGSEGYYEMVNSIDEVTLALQESETQLLEYAKTLQELEFEQFDLLQERISSITEETEFLIDLMSNDKLYDDNGQLTNEGKATMGLHGVAYNTNMHQADLVANEIAKLESELAKDPFDTELEERYREMISLQQEYILAAEDEKNAIRDLVEEGINLEIEALEERIDKYNEALDSQKDLYDYQKKVAESTKEIASLEKQMAAYQGDDSEEAQQKIQKIKLDLESARADLEETEYDKYISDTQQILDNLVLEYEETLNIRLDNIDALLEQTISEINSDASIIGDTIRETTNSVGYTLTDSMKTIWDENSVNTRNVISTYGDRFVNAQTTTNNALNAINTNLQNMINQLDAKAKEKAKSASTSSVAKSNQTNKKPTTSNTTQKQDNATLPKNTLMGIASAIWIYGSKSGWNDDPERKDKLVSIIGAANAKKVQDYINKYGSSGELYNFWIEQGKNLSKYKYNAFKSGSKKIRFSQNAWTQEDGQEYIIRPSDGAILTPVAKGDSILTSAASSNIWSMANNPSEFIKNNLGFAIADAPNNSNVHNNYTQHLDKVVFNFPNVKNYDEFISAMQKDRNFERLIRSMTIDEIAGKSSLTKNKSIR